MSRGEQVRKVNFGKGRLDLFGIQIDAMPMREAVQTIFAIIDRPSWDCHCVVTPNVHHLVILQEHAGLRRAYRDASLVLADGLPVVIASRFLGRALPERVAGSDLIPALFAAANDRQKPLKVYLLGARPGVAARAAQRIESQWPHVKVLGANSPPPGFEHDDTTNERILEQIEATLPDVLIVGLGAPKQELWVHRHRPHIRAKVAVCVGITIEFLSGHQMRAPLWMRKSGLEWLHRLFSDPRRLLARYLRDMWVFPRLVCREMLRPENGRL